VHCFPEFILDDPALRNVKSNGKEARELFALGFAYGLIKQQPGFGDNPPTYAYTSVTKRKNVALSEKGLFDAVWEFVHNPELVEKAKAEIRALEVKISPADLAQKLKAAMEELEFNPEEEALAAELRSVMEERAIKLRSSRRP
jgi:hypothetical protein